MYCDVMYVYKECSRTITHTHTHTHTHTQVFGRLLSSLPEEDRDETDSAEPAEGDKEGKEDEVRDHVVDILFSKGKLSNLQKQVSQCPLVKRSIVSLYINCDELT